MRMTGQKDVNQILVNATDAEAMPALQDEIIVALRRAHRLPPEAPTISRFGNQTEVMSVMTENHPHSDFAAGFRSLRSVCWWAASAL